MKNPSPNVRELGRAPLVKAGKKSIPAVRKLLTQPNTFIRGRAIWLLAKLGSEGLSIVEGQLNHEDENVRICAFRALRHENHRILKHAAKLAKDPSPSVRREVALAMRATNHLIKPGIFFLKLPRVTMVKIVTMWRLSELVAPTRRKKSTLN